MVGNAGPVRTLVDAGGEASERAFRVLVSVANPATCEELIRTGSALAAAHDGELVVLSVVVTDDPATAAEDDPGAESSRAVLERARTLAEDVGTDVPTRRLLRAATSPAAGILDTAREFDADRLLLGWHGGRSSVADVVIGSVVDEVTANTDRDVLVERVGDGIGPVDSILVPIAGGVHSGLAVSTARDVAHATDAALTVGTVVGPGATDAERDSYAAMLEDATADVTDVPVETRLLEGESIADTIVVESREYDLTVVGATGKGSLEELLFDSVTAQVARRASGRIVIARRSGRRSRLASLRRWLSQSWR